MNPTLIACLKSLLHLDRFLLIKSDSHNEGDFYWLLSLLHKLHLEIFLRRGFKSIIHTLSHLLNYFIERHVFY